MSYNVMDSNRQQDINRDAVYNLFMYFDIEAEDLNRDGIITFEEAVETIGNHYSSFENDESRKNNYNALKQFLKNDPSLGRIQIQHQDIRSSENPYATAAACFYDPDKETLTITFRGTQDGEWYNNAEVISTDTPTEEQQNAVKYFNNVIESIGKDTDLKIRVTGHSNGGNKATTVIYDSEYGYLVDEVVAFDGQGYSEERINDWKKNLGDVEYNNRKDKIIYVNGENDFVNPLGYKDADDSHVYYVETPTQDDKFDGRCYHDILYMFVEGYDEDGNPIFKDDYDLTYTDQKEVGKIVKRINEELMKMDPGDREQTGKTIMALIEAGEGDYRLNGLYGDNALDTLNNDFPGFLAEGLPASLFVLCNTEEGQDFLEKYGNDLLNELVFEKMKNYIKEHPVKAVANAVVVIVFLPKIIKYTVTKAIADYYIDFIRDAKEVAKNVGEFIYNSYHIILNEIYISLGLNKNGMSGADYAANYPYFSINTDTLREYSTRIDRVNKRLGDLDVRIDNLYLRVRLVDLWNLLMSDLRIGHSFVLTMNCNYLNEVASEFDSIEDQLKNSC